MRFGFHATLGEALAATMRVRMVAPDPKGGAEIIGEIVASASETHVILRAADGQEFTVPMAGLRVVPLDRSTDAEVAAS